MRRKGKTRTMNIGIKARTKAITQMRPMRARRMAKGKMRMMTKAPQ